MPTDEGGILSQWFSSTQLQLNRLSNDDHVLPTSASDREVKGNLPLFSDDLLLLPGLTQTSPPLGSLPGLP